VDAPRPEYRLHRVGQYSRRTLLAKSGVMGLVVALHGVILWLLLVEAMPNSKPQPRIVEVVVQMIDQSLPTPEPTPDTAPQIPRMAVRVPQVSLTAPTEAPDGEQSSSITRAISRASAPSPAEDAAVKPPDFEADYLSNPAPIYPPLSRRLHEQGITCLRVQVNAAGKPTSIEIEQSSGFERLDRAAVAAVWRWSFVPARLRGAAVAAWVIVPIRFTLSS